MGNKYSQFLRLLSLALAVGLSAVGCSAGGSPHPEEALAREAIVKQMGPDVSLKELSVSWSDAKDKGESKFAPFKARFEVTKDLYVLDPDYHEEELKRRGLPGRLRTIRGWDPQNNHLTPAFFALLNPKGTSVTAYGKLAYQRQVDRWLVEAGEIDLGEAKTVRRGFMGLDGTSFGDDLPASAKDGLARDVPAYRIGSPEAKAYFDSVERKVKELSR